MKKTPKALDTIADVVLAYRPTARSGPAVQRKRRKTNSLSPRFATLADKGLIRDSHQRRRNPKSNRNAIVWELTPPGQESPRDGRPPANPRGLPDMRTHQAHTGEPMKPICAPCKRFFRMVKSGFYFIEGMPSGVVARPPAGNEAPELWKPYKIWAGDLWRCEGCGTEIVHGTGAGPINEHYKPDFEDTVKRLGADQLQVNDC